MQVPVAEAQAVELAHFAFVNIHLEHMPFVRRLHLWTCPPRFATSHFNARGVAYDMMMNCLHAVLKQGTLKPTALQWHGWLLIQRTLKVDVSGSPLSRKFL